MQVFIWDVKHIDSQQHQKVNGRWTSLIKLCTRAGCCTLGCLLFYEVTYLDFVAAFVVCVMERLEAIWDNYCRGEGPWIGEVANEMQLE